MMRTFHFRFPARRGGGAEAREALRGRKPKTKNPISKIALALLLGLTGCATPPRGAVAPPPAPSYEPFRETYNRRVRRVQQLWARAVVEAHWVDEKGERHFEQGDGPLILRKPGDLALAVGKLGNTLYWLGSDGARFWLFDLTGGPTRAYIGRVNGGGRIQSRLPLPLRPDLLMGLIGLTPLPDSNETAVNVVRDEENPGRFRYRVRLPVEGTADLQRVIVLDPETNHPVRISFRSSGETLLRADLSRYQRLPRSDSSPSAWPDVPTRIEITAPGRDARFTLFLSDLTEGKNKIRDAQFDLDRLMEIHDPDEVRTLPSPSAGRS